MTRSTDHNTGATIEAGNDSSTSVFRRERDCCHRVAEYAGSEVPWDNAPGALAAMSTTQIASRQSLSGTRDRRRCQNAVNSNSACQCGAGIPTRQWSSNSGTLKT